MTNILETLFNVVYGTITGLAQAITTTIESVQDFFLVRINGLNFIVLGSRQVGKTTLIEWLRANMETLDDFEPEPTAAGGEIVADFNAKSTVSRCDSSPRATSAASSPCGKPIG